MEVMPYQPTYSELGLNIRIIYHLFVLKINSSSADKSLFLL